MTVQDYLRVLREQWLIIVSAVVVALTAACAVSLLRPPERPCGSAQLLPGLPANSGQEVKHLSAERRHRGCHGALSIPVAYA